jgi:hypothetical protein
MSFFAYLVSLFRKVFPPRPGEDADLELFRADVARAMLLFPASYSKNLQVYRESRAFPEGSGTTLVALFDSELTITAVHQVCAALAGSQHVPADGVRNPRDVAGPRLSNAICRDVAWF